LKYFCKSHIASCKMGGLNIKYAKIWCKIKVLPSF
jgi:hypothetical protein